MSEQQTEQNNNNNNETQPKQPTTEESKPAEQLDDAQLDEEIRTTRQKLRELILQRKQLRRQKCKGKGKKGQHQPPNEGEQPEWGPDPEFSQWGPGYWPEPWGKRHGHREHHGGHKHNKHYGQWAQYPPFFNPWYQWGQQQEDGSSEENPQGPSPCQVHGPCQKGKHRGPPCQGPPQVEPCDKKRRCHQPPQGQPPCGPQGQAPPQGPPDHQRRRGPKRMHGPPPEWAMYYGQGYYQNAPEQDGSSSSSEEESTGEYDQQEGNAPPGYYGQDW